MAAVSVGRRGGWGLGLSATYLTNIADPGRLLLHSQRVQVHNFGGSHLFVDYQFEIVMLGARDERLQRLHFTNGRLAALPAHVGAAGRPTRVRATRRRCDRRKRRAYYKYANTGGGYARAACTCTRHDGLQPTKSVASLDDSAYHLLRGAFRSDLRSVSY